MDSAFANADFNANFGYGGENPPEVPIENIFDRVISNESPVNVEKLISFPVPALTLGAVSFTATTNGFSDTIIEPSEPVSEPTSVLSLLALAGLGIASIIKIGKI